MAFLYGRAGRLNTKNTGFRPGQSGEADSAEEGTRLPNTGGQKNERSGGTGEPEAEPTSMWQALLTLECWLLLLTCFVVMGCGSVVSTNLPQLFEAAEQHHNATGGDIAVTATAAAVTRDTALGISLYSVVSTSSRLLAPMVLGSLTKLSLPSAAVFAGLSATALAAQLSLAMAQRWFIFAGVGLSGVCSGLFWTSYPIVVRDLWGTKHLGAHYKLTNIPDSGAAIIFNKGADSPYCLPLRAVTPLLRGFFAGVSLCARTVLRFDIFVAARCCWYAVLVIYFYDKATSPGSNTCVGSACFRPSHLILAGCCAVIFLANIFLVHRVQARRSNVMRAHGGSGVAAAAVSVAVQ
jgi:hypothetical protein